MHPLVGDADFDSLRYRVGWRVNASTLAFRDLTLLRNERNVGRFVLVFIGYLANNRCRPEANAGAKTPRVERLLQRVPLLNTGDLT
jgi:hypothetical protein